MIEVKGSEQGAVNLVVPHMGLRPKPTFLFHLHFKFSNFWRLMQPHDPSMWPRKLYLNYSVFLMGVLFFLGFCCIHMGADHIIKKKRKKKRKKSDLGEGSVAYVVKKLVGISWCWTVL